MSQAEAGTALVVEYALQCTVHAELASHHCGQCKHLCDLCTLSPCCLLCPSHTPRQPIHRIKPVDKQTNEQTNNQILIYTQTHPDLRTETDANTHGFSLSCIRHDQSAHICMQEVPHQTLSHGEGLGGLYLGNASVQADTSHALQATMLTEPSNYSGATYAIPSGTVSAYRAEATPQPRPPPAAQTVQEPPADSARGTPAAATPSAAQPLWRTALRATERGGAAPAAARQRLSDGAAGSNGRAAAPSPASPAAASAHNLAAPVNDSLVSVATPQPVALMPVRPL